MILTLRTDNPQAEIGLYQDGKKVQYARWQAHRELAETIHQKIQAMLQAAGQDWSDVSGLVVYRGPGSFTGLRIGLTVAIALAYSNGLPIVGAMGENWLQNGLLMLQNGKDEHIVTPEYGSDVHITPPKK